MRPVSRKNDFGFTLGGPLRIPKIYNGKDKTFYFFNWEYFRNKTASTGTPQTVPTAAYRAGDFSAALTNRTLATENSSLETCTSLIRVVAFSGVRYMPWLGPRVRRLSILSY